MLPGTMSFPEEGGERARDHRTALRSCPSSGHQRPGALAQRKTRGPPRRPTTATPSLRPVLDRKAGTEAAHLRLQHRAAYFKTARRATTSRAECRRRRHSTQARRAPGFSLLATRQRAEQRTTKVSSLPLQTSATPTALAAAKLVV